MDSAIPNAEVSRLPPPLRSWFPANATAAILKTEFGAPPETLDRVLTVRSPLTYAPVIQKDHLMAVVASATASRLRAELRLWEHWGQARS